MTDEKNISYIYGKHHSGDYCIPFQNICWMKLKKEKELLLETVTGRELNFISGECDLERSWEAWLKYCGKD